MLACSVVYRVSWLMFIPWLANAKDSCFELSYKGDGFCDDENNEGTCDYDGGDCCGNIADGWNQYCTECSCKDPGIIDTKEALFNACLFDLRCGINVSAVCFSCASLL